MTSVTRPVWIPEGMTRHHMRHVPTIRDDEGLFCSGGEEPPGPSLRQCLEEASSKRTPHLKPPVLRDIGSSQRCNTTNRLRKIKAISPAQVVRAATERDDLSGSNQARSNAMVDAANTSRRSQRERSATSKVIVKSLGRRKASQLASPRILPRATQQWPAADDCKTTSRAKAQAAGASPTCP